MKGWRWLAAGVLLVAGMGQGRAAMGEVNLMGAGSTFAKPIYDKWGSVYSQAHPEVRFNYQGIGSGGGIRQITGRTVDFGATDGPMTDAQLSKAPGALLHIPTVLGAVVPIYHLPEVDRPLVFSGEVLAGIYLGKITRWNDPKLAALNPDVSLPDRPIATVHRSDGSGTTYIFSDYLSKVSSDWEKGPGRSTTINWPVGRGAKGNDGVAADVKQNAGSIGYVELIYAANNQIAYGGVINASGKAVFASVESVSAAAAGLKDPAEDLRISITNPPGESAYPISSLTWILVYQQQEDAQKGQALVDFLWWAVHDGQALAGPMAYAPLPAEFIPRVEQKLRSITAGGRPLLEGR